MSTSRIFRSPGPAVLLLAVLLHTLTLAAPRPPPAQAAAPAAAAGLASATMPPHAEKSVRFAIIGDTGTGDHPQYEVGERLAASRGVFPFEFVLMLGDNIYGGERPQDFEKKFERPYQ